MITEKWTVIDSGGRVMLKAVGEPQIICTLETVPLKISPKVHDRAHLIAAAPDLLGLIKRINRHLHGGGTIRPDNGIHIAIREALAAAEPN